jgi:hypothetical protein
LNTAVCAIEICFWYKEDRKRIDGYVAMISLIEEKIRHSVVITEITMAVINILKIKSISEITQLEFEAHSLDAA